MKYQEATIKNGQVIITKSKNINQSKLISDCWLIQFNGLTACQDCELKNTKDCGGGNTLKRLQSI